eukprot:scaffold206_cov147-Skeletonema_marinoi.AAC.6
MSPVTRHTSRAARSDQKYRSPPPRKQAGHRPQAAISALQKIVQQTVQRIKYYHEPKSRA